LITIVDYGLGNVQAIANIYKRLGVPVKSATDSEDLQGARKLVLPGVGAFDWAMRRLDESGMRQRIEDAVRKEKADVLGICVGMQMMAQRSDEGVCDGLGWIEADVKLFDRKRVGDKAQLPHMGWNDVTPRSGGGLFKGLESGARFYFLHSYYFAPKRDADVLAVTNYYGDFASSVRRENVYGVQFHPEKSHHWGVQLLKNFAEL
jgi:glutamine amidotransferase